MRTLTGLYWIAPLTLVLSSCGGPGAPAQALRPADPTAAGALGEGAGECKQVESHGEPLVVDWKPEQRGDLEVAMREGIAVVEYSCKGIRLLPDCHLEGHYGYMGMTKKEQFVRLENADEVRANLPTLPLSAKLGGELQRGSTLDIALVMIGKKRTTWSTPSRDDLKGQCDGATHFVRGATVGAFVMESGTKAKARAVAELFGAGGDAQSSSSKSVRNQEGELSDCRQASPDSEKPPSQCGSPLRLEMVAIAPGGAQAPAEEPAAQPSKLAVPEEPCPKGLVFSEGKCTAPATAPAYLCDPNNFDECTAQCAKGHAGSCGALASFYASGQHVGRDEAKAAELLKKACDGGDTRGCVNLGVVTASGKGLAANPQAAATLFEKGCHDGDALGCSQLGQAYLAGSGVAKAETKAAGLLKQGCEGGEDKACAALAPMYAQGRGVQKDPRKAADLYQKACSGRDITSCNALGLMMESGKDIGKNPVGAGIYYRRGCWRFDSESCVNLARLELGSNMAGGSPDEAKRYVEQACMRNDSMACAIMKVAFGGTHPVFPDVAKGNESRQRCASGDARECATIGVMEAATGNSVMAKTDLQRACTMGDGFACAMQKLVK